MEDRKRVNESSDEMEYSPKDNDDCEGGLQDMSEESCRNPTTLGNQVLPSSGQDASENQQLPSSLSAETSFQSSVPTSESPTSPALNIDQLDETVSIKDVFYTSRTLRLRTNCSRSVDALLSPRQFPTDSSMPVLEHSGVNSAKNFRRDRSPLGETSDSASPPQPTPVWVTRSFLKARDGQETPPSLEKQSMKPTSPKKRRTQTSESDSSKSVAKNISSTLSSSAAARTPDKSLSVQPRQMRAAAQKIESPQSHTRTTPSKMKRKITESSCSDSKTAKHAFKSNLRFPISADDIDHKSPTYLETQKRKVAARSLGLSESANEGKTSISFPDYSSDSNSLDKSSNPDDLHQDGSFINFSTDEDGTTIDSNTSTDASSASLDKDSAKRMKGSSASDTWFVEQHDSPEKDPISLKLKRIPTDEASSSTKDCEPIMEEKPHGEFSSVPSEETKSASNMVHSATGIQMLESSQSRSTIQNSDLSSSRLDSGIEARGFKTVPSSRVFLNPHLSISSHFPEQRSSSDIDDPRRALELKNNDQKEGTDQNESDSATRTSEPGVESEKWSICRSVEMLKITNEMFTSRDLPEIQDPEVLREENRSDSLLRRQHSGSISSGASTSRERSEVRMDLDPPCLDACEGQSSTSRNQPVITDGSSAGHGFDSSSGVTPSGEEAGRAMTSTTSATRISKYASNAQKLLLTVLEEMMKFNEEMEQYKRFKDLLLSISEFPCCLTELVLKNELMDYLMERRKTFKDQNKSTSHEISLEYHTKEVYEILIHIVVTALDSTASLQSSLSFDIIMDTYKALKELYEKFILFWRNNDVKDIQDEASRNIVEFLSKKINLLMLQTRNAFRELLVHIGEHADQWIINSYEDQLFEEDKSYLRGQIFVYA